MGHVRLAAAMMRYATVKHPMGMPRINEGETLTMWIDRVWPDTSALRWDHGAFREAMLAAAEIVETKQNHPRAGCFDPLCREHHMVASTQMTATEMEAMLKMYGLPPNLLASPAPKSLQPVSEADRKKAAGWKGADSLPYDSDVD